MRIDGSPRREGVIAVINDYNIGRVRPIRPPYDLEIHTIPLLASGPCRSPPNFVREVLAVRQIKKLVRLFSIRDRFEVFVGVKIHCHDYVKPPTSRSLDVKKTNAILDL